jgi:S1-C subfamily serine protease
MPSNVNKWHTNNTILALSLVFMIAAMGASSSSLARLGTAYGQQPPAQDLGNSNSSNILSSLPFTELFEKAEQSIVQVSATVNETSLFNEDGQPPFFGQALGSGFVYNREGHIITSNHVIFAGSDSRIDVTFTDGTIYRASVVGTDIYSDLAVLQLEDVPEEKLVPLPLGNSSTLNVGQPVAAIGNPFGLSGSLSEGIISGLDRLIPAQAASPEEEPPTNSSSPSPFPPIPLPQQPPATFSIPNVIQTSAPINPGNSGGPLLNMQGQVIGINTAIFSVTGTFAGVGFAIPSNTIAKVVPVLIEEGFYPHPWIGVSGTDMTPEIAEAIGLEEPRGFLVISIQDGSPASRAGIQEGSNETVLPRREIPLGGDVILSIDGTTVRKLDDLLGYLEQSTQVGQIVSLGIWRDGETTEVDLTLTARPGEQE